MGEEGTSRMPPASPPSPPTPAATQRGPAPVATPRVPVVPSTGMCCYGGCNGQCKDSDNWCSQSREHCEGSCNGEWCAAAALSQVRRHRQLRGNDHAFIQKLLRFSPGNNGLHKSEQKHAEL